MGKTTEKKAAGWKNIPASVWIVLAVAFGLRLFLSATTTGYSFDKDCFNSWGDRVLDVGLGAFYSDDVFADYPPGYMYVLALIAAMRRLFSAGYDSALNRIFLTLIPCVCDVAASFLIWKVGMRFVRSKQAAYRLFVFAAFSPLLIFDSAIWKQVDAVLMLPLLVSFMFLEEGDHSRNLLWCALLYGVSLMVKPQALLAGPVMAVSFITWTVLEQKKLRIQAGDEESAFHLLLRNRCFRDIFLGILLALLPVFLSGIPFFGFTGLISGLRTKYFGTASSYQYGSVNACNLMALLGGNWQDESGTIGSSALTWRSLGMTFLVLLTIGLIVGAICLVKKNRFSPIFLAAFYTVGICSLLNEMHERYIVMGVLFLELAAARMDDRRLFLSSFLITIAAFVNLALAYANIWSDLWLTSDVSKEMVFVLSALEVAGFIILLFAYISLCAGGKQLRLRNGSLIEGTEEVTADTDGEEKAFNASSSEPDAGKTLSMNAKQAAKAKTAQMPKAKPTQKTKAQTAQASKAKKKQTSKKKTSGGENSGKKMSQNTGITAPSGEKAPEKGRKIRQPRREPYPVWERGELIFLAAVTITAAILGFTYLGDHKAPTNGVDVTDSSASLVVRIDGGTPTQLEYYPGIGRDGTLTISNDDTGDTLYSGTMEYTSTFTWQTGDLWQSGDGVSSWRIDISNGTVFELCFLDADGNILSPSVTEVTGDATTATAAALFDETGKVPKVLSQLNSMYFDEIYHGRTAYEMLHKLSIYETTHPPLGKDLIMLGIAIFGMNAFGWRVMGVFFGVLLIPLLYVFVRHLTKKPWVSCLCAVIIAFDFMRFVESRLSTIDIYTTFFIVLSAYGMYRFGEVYLTEPETRFQKVPVRKAGVWLLLSGVGFGLACSVKWNGIYAGFGLALVFFYIFARRIRFLKETLPVGRKSAGVHREVGRAAAAGVLCFIAVPLLIYTGSYFPYRWQNPDFGLHDWWQCQVSMYEYHTQLNAENGFTSMWYTWALGLRPYWYYANSRLADGMKASIASVSGPVLWIGGMIAILMLLWRQLDGRGTKKGAFVLVIYFAQVLPWVLVTRLTFNYHYLPGGTVSLLAIGLVWSGMKNERLARRYGIGIAALAVGLFIWFYPILTGLPVSSGYANLLSLLPSWGFYY